MTSLLNSTKLLTRTTNNCSQTIHNNEGKVTLLNSLDKANITLIPKPEKNNDEKT